MLRFATLLPFTAVAVPAPTTMKELLMLDRNATCGAEVFDAMTSGCVDRNGSACKQYSLPMAQAFTALANAGQCGPNQNLKSWSCSECKKVGFDVVPDSATVVTGREIFQGDATSIYVAKVKGSFPGSKPRPAEALKHSGEDCFDHCRQVEGYCDWCGVGNACVQLADAANASHRCVKPSATEVTQASKDDTFGCALAVRGSSNVDNWIMNFVFPMEDMKFGDQCPGCKGVTGWLTVWREIEFKIMTALSDLGCVPGSSQGNLLVTGHSLGASVATLAMFHLQRKGYNVVQSYNFEGTRVGNQAWSAAFQTAFDRDVPVFRVTHSADIVVRLPPQLEILNSTIHLGGFDYKHVASEVFFPGADPNTNVICEGPEDKNCADRQMWLPSLLESISHQFKDHCYGPLGAHKSFCYCPVSSSSPAPLDASYVV